MIKTLSALVIAACAVLPAGAVPRVIVNPTERMVLVPHLEYHGPSRISTVEHCAELLEVEDWTDMITDADLLGMEACLIEHT